MGIDVINQIMKTYREKKQYMNPSIVGEDIVSFTVKRQTTNEFTKLKNDTIQKLTDLYKNIEDKLEDLNNKLNNLNKKIAKSNKYEKPILEDKKANLESNIINLNEQRDLINAYLKNEFGIDNMPQKREEAEELVDVRKELKNNSKLLEDSIVNIPSLNIRGNYIIDNNDEDSTQIKPRSVKLFEGKYVSRTDFKRAVMEYYNKTKNKKMMVTDTRDGELTPTNIKDLQDLFKDCHSIFIDLERNAYASDEENIEMIGKVPESILPGSYIPLDDAIDEVSGGAGRSLVKRHE